MTTKKLVEELIEYNKESVIPWGLSGEHYQLPNQTVKEIIERLEEYNKLEEHRNHIEHCPPRNN